MDLAKLREWIKYTRDTEGVSWYLRDVTKTLEFNQIFSLIVYSDSGEVAHSVEFIEPRRGVIPEKFLSRIADAREHAGINSGFVFSLKNDATRNAAEIFRQRRSDWLSEGKQAWLAMHVAAKG